MKSWKNTSKSHNKFGFRLAMEVYGVNLVLAL